MRDSVINDIVSQLFSARALLVEKPEQVSLEERFWVISSDKGPRWIVPFQSAYGLPVLRQWQPYGRLSSAKWTILKLAYGLGQLRQFPNVTLIGVAGANTQHWLHLGFQIAQGFVPIIYVGTPGTTRKAVVTLLDKSTRESVGIVKLPLGDMAAANIISEANILKCLSVELPGLAPQCLFADPQKGMMVQQALLGKPVGRALTPAHIHWLARLNNKTETTTIQSQSGQLARRLDAEQNLSERDRISIKTVLQKLTDSVPLPMTWIHGDFAPWNLKWKANPSQKSLVAVDWEDAKPKGLPLYDLFHHQYMQAYLFNIKKTVLAGTWNAGIVNQYVQSLNMTQAQFEQIALYYLTDMWFQASVRKKNQDANYFRSEALTLANLIL